MSGLPFDPWRLSGRDPAPERSARRRTPARTPPGEAGDRPLSVSELSGLIRTTLEQRLASPLHVVGQVSNLATPNHWYFSLKDEQSIVSCVAWASVARRFGFTPADGDEVIASGHVSHYGPQGRTQFYVDSLVPVGAGALQVRFQAMCEELRGLGYFDPARKKPLPAFPRRVAVITSAGGAAIHDVTSTAAQRCPAVGLVLIDVRVQGDGAADEVARAIRWVDARHATLGVDVVLVTRGGGAIEDLWTFNERVVADATLACSLPIVAAIGHESDTTVIELVADHRAATPTQATMAIVPSAEALRQQVDHLADRMRTLLRRRIERGRHRLDAATDREIFRRPASRLARERRRVNELGRGLHRATVTRAARERGRLERLAGTLARLRPETLLARRHQRIAVLEDRLGRLVRQRLALSRQRVDARERELDALDPRRVLQRGFSCTMTAAGDLVRTVAEVRAGDRIRTHVADGSFDSTVTPTAATRRPRRRSTPEDRRADQMDLFGSKE